MQQKIFFDSVKSGDETGVKLKLFVRDAYGNLHQFICISQPKRKWLKLD